MNLIQNKIFLKKNFKIYNYSKKSKVWLYDTGMEIQNFHMILSALEKGIFLEKKGTF